MVSMATADENSETKPITGSSLVTPLPTVFMMRWPPMEVPRAMVAAHMILTQVGTPEPSGSMPAPIIASVIMPMVFCASLLPWL